MRVRCVLSGPPDFLETPDAVATRSSWRIRMLDAGLDERFERQSMQARQGAHVVTHYGVALLGGEPVEPGLPFDTFHYVGRQVVDPPVDGGDGDTVRPHDVLHRHLVTQRELHRDVVPALAADHQPQRVTIALGVDNPGGPPPRLALDAGDMSSHPVVDPTGDEFVCTGDSDIHMWSLLKRKVITNVTGSRGRKEPPSPLGPIQRLSDECRSPVPADPSRHRPRAASVIALQRRGTEVRSWPLVPCR